MQTTLLGLAIAFIIALVAALIGPFFIDWSQFRPQFEAEASRVLGTQVRVGGALDARLLPAPSLRLRSVSVGGVNDLGKVRAEKLDVEFSLSALMRGEVRATELTINGAAVDLGLDGKGRIDWPASSGVYNLGSLAIDRLNLTGRIALHDAASRRTLELDDIAFSGDVRALAGAIRGDGNFMLAGTRYPFRLSSGQSSDQTGTRVHLTIDPAVQPLAIDLDGLLTFEARAPRFDGALIFARPAPPKSSTADTATPPPWKIAAKVKADPAAAAFDQLELSYGAEETALKLAGTADARFGPDPLVRATLAAKSIDADRALGLGGGDLAKLLPGLAGLIETLPPPPLAAKVAISSDQIILGGRPIQNVVADLRSDGAGWTLDRLDLRAPGATRVTLSSGTSSALTSSGFNGALDLDTADPDTFAAWLLGRSDLATRSQKPLRLRGQLTLADDRTSIEGMTAEIDGSAVGGRMAFVHADRAPSRFEADVKAERLDLDSTSALLRALAGPQVSWPDEAKVSLDIGRAISAGQEMKPFGVALSYGAERLTLDRLHIGEASGVTIDGSGAFARKDATGQLTLNATTPSLARLASLLEQTAPAVASRLSAVPGTDGAARLKLTLDLDKNTARPDRASARAVLNLDAPQIKGAVTFSATPVIAAVRSFDLDALRKGDVSLATTVSSPRGDTLLAVLGLDQAVTAGDGPLQFDGSATGAWNVPLRLTAKLSGASLDAEAQGTAEPWAEPRKAAMKLMVRRANVAPLFALKATDAVAQNVSLSSRLTLAGDRWSFDDLDGVVAGARLRGHLALTSGEQKTIDGEVGLDRIDLVSAFAVAIGSAGRDEGQPLGPGWLRGWQGQLAFQALRGTLPSGLELRPVGGIVKGDRQSLSVSALKGDIGGGTITADIDARPSLSGLALTARVQMAGVDGAALRYRALAMPASRAALRMTLTSQGRSASALSGALSGDGLLMLEQARISGLDTRAFDVAIRASDGGQLTNDAKLRDLVAPVLSAGALSVASAQIPFTIKDGRLRVESTALDAEGARATISGGYDIAADQTDIRASIIPTTLPGPVAGRPDIQIFAVGSPDGLDRAVDVASLSSWLAVRTIDRETRRLDSLEREATPQPATPVAIPPPAASLAPTQPVPDTPLPRAAPARPRFTAPRPPAPPQAAAPSSSSAQVAPLPPAIDVRPAPGAVRAPRPKPPLVLTPSPSSLPRTAF